MILLIASVLYALATVGQFAIAVYNYRRRCETIAMEASNGERQSANIARLERLNVVTPFNTRSPRKDMLS